MNLMEFVMKYGFVMTMVISIFAGLFIYAVWLTNTAFDDGWNAGRDWKQNQVNAFLRCYDWSCMMNESTINITCGIEAKELYGEEPRFRDWRFTKQP